MLGKKQSPVMALVQETKQKRVQKENESRRNRMTEEIAKWFTIIGFTLVFIAMMLIMFDA